MNGLTTRKRMTTLLVGASVLAFTTGSALALKGPNDKANDRAKEQTKERDQSEGKAKNKDKGKSGEKGRKVHSGLEVGDEAPGGVLTTIDGESVELSSLYGDGPVIVTFYRGSWCPFCNKALTSWQDSLAAIDEAGATWIAITPEKPSFTKETSEKFGGVTVLSDSEFEVAKAFGLYFDVDDQTKKLYKGYDIDVAEHNAAGHWGLPHPSTYIIDSQGVIRFAEVHLNYRERTDPDDVIAALAEID